MKEEYIPIKELKVKEIIEHVPLTINFNDIVIIIRRFSKIIDERSWEIPTHFHDYYEFHYVAGGKGHIEVENNSFDVSEGDFYITAPFVRHRQLSSKIHPLQNYTIECKIMLPEVGKTKTEDSDISFFKNLISLSYYSKFTDKNKLMQDMFALEKEADEKKPGYWLRMESLFVTVIIEFLSTASISNEYNNNENKNNYYVQRIPKILNFIEKNVYKTLTVEDVAKELYLSPRHINRILNNDLNMSFNKYVTKVRIETALKLLRESNSTVSEIANMAGFGNYLQMFRALKKNGYPSASKIKEGETSWSAEHSDLEI